MCIYVTYYCIFKYGGKQTGAPPTSRTGQAILTAQQGDSPTCRLQTWLPMGRNVTWGDYVSVRAAFSSCLLRCYDIQLWAEYASIFKKKIDGRKLKETSWLTHEPPCRMELRRTSTHWSQGAESVWHQALWLNLGTADVGSWWWLDRGFLFCSYDSSKDKAKAGANEFTCCKRMRKWPWQEDLVAWSLPPVRVANGFEEPSKMLFQQFLSEMYRSSPILKELFPKSDSPLGLGGLNATS